MNHTPAGEALQGVSDVYAQFYGSAYGGAGRPRFGPPDEGAPDPEDVGHVAHVQRPLTPEQAVARALGRRSASDQPAED